MEGQMLKKSVLLLNLFLAFLLTPASGTGGSHGEGTSETKHGRQKENQIHSTGAGTKGLVKIMLVDTMNPHGQKLSVESHQIGIDTEGIECSYVISRSSYQIYAELKLSGCHPPLKNPEQLRGLWLRLRYLDPKFPDTRQYLSVNYNMEKEMSAEDLEKFFHGGVFYRMITHADISKLYVNENGIAIPAAGNFQRQQDLLENQKAAKDGRLTFTSIIQNEHQEPVKVKNALYKGSVYYFADLNPVKFVTCRADYVEPESTPTQLKFAVELAQCDTPLEAIPDLKEMKLEFSYSVGEGQWQPNVN